MHLDQHTSFSQLDTTHLLAAIDDVPDQLQAAWEWGLTQPLPDWQQIDNVLIAGMGTSASAADLLTAYLADRCAIPIIVHRDYGLPGWAKDQHTLVIASSHSGKTEETLDAFSEAVRRGCRTMATTAGGKLLPEMIEPSWAYPLTTQTPITLGSSYGLLLAAFTRLGLILDPTADLSSAIATLRKQQNDLQAQVPIPQNPAKRLAGQLMGRWVSVFGSGLLAPVARYWKGQISVMAKTWSQFECLPEADHNTAAATLHPESLLSYTFTLFLRAEADNPRNHMRADLTRHHFMLEGLATDQIDALGENGLANQWSLVHFGDYVAYYLAILYDVNPAPGEVLQAFKDELASV